MNYLLNEAAAYINVGNNLLEIPDGSTKEQMDEIIIADNTWSLLYNFDKELRSLMHRITIECREAQTNIRPKYKSLDEKMSDKTDYQVRYPSCISEMMRISNYLAPVLKKAKLKKDAENPSHAETLSGAFSKEADKSAVNVKQNEGINNNIAEYASDVLNNTFKRKSADKTLEEANQRRKDLADILAGIKQETVTD